MSKIKNYIDNLDRRYAEVREPSTEKQILSCDKKLLENESPQMPDDLKAFYLICSGFRFNGLDFWGPNKKEIVEENIRLQCYYESPELLYLGRIDDDIYTYNQDLKCYESRDISGFDVWDSYASFETFFMGEIVKWLE